jgi:arylsulfatase A-like enzyme
MISPSPWTVPSHASIFTGLYPRTHGCWFGNQRWLHDDVVTLAERFKEAGYETAAFVSNGYLFVTNLLQGFEVQQKAFGDYDKLVLTRVMRYTGVGFEQWIDKGSAETVGSVDAWLRNRDPNRPFLLFVNLFEAHDPYHPPIRDRALPPGATNLDAIRATRRFEFASWHSLGRTVGKHEDVIRALYASEVRYQDRLLGQIMRVIEGHVHLDDLVLVITSDHGENLGEGGRWGHLFAVNDALIRVPLIIRSPARFPAGKRESGAFQTIDIGSTLLELAGLNPGLGEGRTLVPPARAPRDRTFAEVYPDYFRISQLRVGFRPGLGDFRRPIRTIRHDGRKLVVWGSETARLYDLSPDPREELDIAQEEPEHVRELAARLEQWDAARPQRITDRESRSPMDRATREQLRALGYLR